MMFIKFEDTFEDTFEASVCNAETTILRDHGAAGAHFGASALVELQKNHHAQG